MWNACRVQEARRHRDGKGLVERATYGIFAATAHKKADSKEPMVDSALELSQVRPMASVFGDLVEDNTLYRLPLTPASRWGRKIYVPYHTLAIDALDDPLYSPRLRPSS